MEIATIFRGLIEHPLNHQTKIKAILHFLKWQVGSRLLSGPVVVDFVNRAKLLVGLRLTGATGYLYNGLHKFEDMGFLLHLLRNDDLFVNIGANLVPIQSSLQQCFVRGPKPLIPSLDFRLVEKECCRG